MHIGVKINGKADSIMSPIWYEKSVTNNKSRPQLNTWNDKDQPCLKVGYYKPIPQGISQ